VRIINPKKTLYAHFPVPPSQVVSVRVAANETVNVFAMDEQTLEVFLKDKKAPRAALANSPVGARHEFSVRLPPLAKWYLVIENPWDKKVDVDYAVVALTPVISGAGATSLMGPGATSTSVSVFGAGSALTRSRS
jgi:hypothetical protein